MQPSKVVSEKTVTEQYSQVQGYQITITQKDSPYKLDMYMVDGKYLPPKDLEKLLRFYFEKAICNLVWDKFCLKHFEYKVLTLEEINMLIDELKRMEISRSRELGGGSSADIKHLLSSSIASQPVVTAWASSQVILTSL